MRDFRHTVWFLVVSFVFATFLCTVLIMAVLLIAFLRFNPVETGLPLQTFSVIVFALISIVIGTTLASLFGRVIITPLQRLSRAMKRVSRGDFSVRVEYDQENDIGALIHEFNKMVSDLNSIETLKSDFVTNVSHEFKTPIASIEGCATLLQDPSLSETERAEYAALISKAARQLSVLTSNVLSLSKLENQELVPRQIRFSLDEQIRLAILMLEPQWSEREIEFSIELESVSVFGAEELFMQVWLNLIGNAIKFSNPGGCISISLTETGRRAIFMITDEGAGMSEETLRHMYDKFYQGDRSHSHGGNGLGLSLVKRILDLTGGSISVDSIPYEGSTFTVTLPKNREQPRRD